MLDEKYKMALKGLKAQAIAVSNMDSVELTEAHRIMSKYQELAKHIYRLCMQHHVPVTDLAEEQLDLYLTQEYETQEVLFVEYDGLHLADLTRDVEVYPSTTRGYFSEPIEGQIYHLPAVETTAMLRQLVGINRLTLITDTIQSLAQRIDGTQLQTAFPTVDEVIACVDAGLQLPDSLLEKIDEWKELGATEINFDFVELTTIMVHGKSVIMKNGRICDFLEPEHGLVHASYELEEAEGECVALLKIIKVANEQYIVIDINGVNLSFSYPHIFLAIASDELQLFDSLDQAIDRINSELRVSVSDVTQKVKIVKGCKFDEDWFWLHPNRLVSKGG